MPRIPTARPDDSTIFGSAPTKQATGQAMGANVFAAQQQVGDALNRAALAIGNTRRSIRVGQAYSEAMAELDEYGQNLVNGFQDENGNLIDPPNPEDHSQMWDDKVVEVGDKMRKWLGDDASYKAFSNRFQQSALRASVTVRKNALVQQKAQISADVATTLENLSVLAGKAAIDGDALVHNDVISQAELTFEDLVSKRVWSPEKAQEEREKFLNQVDEAHIRGLINKDPMVALGQLQDFEIWPNLSEADRQKWIEVAVDQEATNVSRRRATENYEHTQKTRAFDEREKELVREFEKMARENPDQLTPDLILQHKDEMDVPTLQYYIARASGDNTWTTDRATYNDLFIRAHNGDKTALKQAGLAFKNKKIGRSEHDKIYSIYDSVTGGDGSKVLPGYYTQAVQIIKTQLKVSDLNPSVGASSRLSSALERFMIYAQENPDVSFSDAVKEAREIADSYTFMSETQLDETGLATGTPRFMKPERGESRENFDLQRVFKETEEAWKRGELSDSQYEAELELIGVYEKIFDKTGVNQAYEEAREKQRMIEEEQRRIREERQRIEKSIETNPDAAAARKRALDAKKKAEERKNKKPAEEPRKRGGGASGGWGEDEVEETIIPSAPPIPTSGVRG